MFLARRGSVECAACSPLVLLLRARICLCTAGARISRLRNSYYSLAFLGRYIFQLPWCVSAEMLLDAQGLGNRRLPFFLEQTALANVETHTAILTAQFLPTAALHTI